jgi:hypothetical protein
MNKTLILSCSQHQLRSEKVFKHQRKVFMIKNFLAVTDDKERETLVFVPESLTNDTNDIMC